MLTSAGSTLGEDCYIDSPLLMCDEALSSHLVSEMGEEREIHLFPQQADNVTFIQKGLNMFKLLYCFLGISCIKPYKKIYSMHH